MKTSSSQFDMMVTFMEQHGDLSKLSPTNARGRITTMKNWEKLTQLLNSDGSGDTKTTEKWKKVWSDFKNNTKKKVARLHRAATGTGGGPAVFVKLTDLEQRVLNLIGVQVTTDLAVGEAGLSQPEPVTSVQPTPHRARTTTRGSPRRRMRPAHMKQASLHFVQADSFWRNFKKQQHNDHMDLRREQNRIREMEVQAQRDWQALGHRGLNLLEKIVDKFCKD